MRCFLPGREQATQLRGHILIVGIVLRRQAGPAPGHFVFWGASTVLMSTPFGISFSTLLSRAQAASRAEDAPWQLTRTRLTRRQVLRETKRGSARPWRLEKKAKSEHVFLFFFRSLVLSRLFTFFSFLGADALWPLTPLSLRQEKPRVSTFPQPPLSRPLQTIGVLPDFKPAIPASRTFFPDKESAHETRDIAFFISPRGTQHSLSSSFPANVRR